MKQKTIKKILLVGVLFLFSSVFLWNCDKDHSHDHDHDILGIENVTRQYERNVVSIDEVIGIRDYLKKTLNRDIKGRATEIDGAIFDEDNILEVIDTLQNANYSFRFRYPDTPTKEFYNLVVGKTPQGEFKTPYVLKYTCDDAFVDEFVENNFDFEYFKGKVALHKYTDYFNIDSFSRTDDECPTQYDANGDPIACEETHVDGGSSPVSNGNNNTDPTNNGTGSNGSNPIDGGGTYGGNCSYLGLYALNCGGTNTDNLHLYAECNGPNRESADLFAVWDCEGSTRRMRSTDCPECNIDTEGAVGINTPLSALEKINILQEALNLSRNSDELAFLDNNP